MEWDPLVSIIIPLYNGSNYIEEAITCALNQTYQNIEIVVVNDGSTDDGAGRDICQKYIDKIVYVEKENGGCASALNHGVRIAKGEYVSWLSHDDLYDNDKIERQIRLIEQKKLDVNNTVISNPARLISGTGKTIFHPTPKTKGFFNGKKAYRYLLHKKTFNGCGLLIPKSIFQRTNYFEESMRYILDWDLWLKFAIAGVDFYLDNKIIVSNRCHGAQVTVKQKQLYQLETTQMVKSLFENLKANEDTFYVKELYYFAYGTKREGWKEIRAYCKEKKIRLCLFRSTALRIKSSVVGCMKKVYHKLRKR